MTRTLNKPPKIDESIIGVVLGTKFVHVDCFDSDEECLSALEDETNNVVVTRDNTWAADVGLCVKCQGLALEEPIR